MINCLVYKLGVYTAEGRRLTIPPLSLYRGIFLYALAGGWG